MRPIIFQIEESSLLHSRKWTSNISIGVAAIGGVYTEINYGVYHFFLEKGVATPQPLRRLKRTGPRDQTRVAGLIPRVSDQTS
jgi:hypothetical protein